MVRLLLILAIGVAIGYVYGFDDAQHNTETVFVRYLDRVGGDARDYSSNNADALMLQAER